MFAHEQYDALRTGAGLLDRRSRGRLQLTGSDRRGYLHGLLTNDILALSAGAGCYAALLTPQGRMISDMRVSELGGMILVDLPASTAGDVGRRFADFIFTEDVEVVDVTAPLGQLGLYGPAASATLAAVLTPASEDDEPSARGGRLDGMPVNANAPWQIGGTLVSVVRSDDYGALGFDLFVEAGRVEDLRQALGRAGAGEVSPEAVEATRVEAGRPEFGADMDEHTIPLEAGIEDRAISLTKGCYVGQEIIIRVLHRGQGRVARHLVGLVGDPQDGGLARGERLQRDEKDLGVITSAVLSPALRRPIALGYARRDHAAPGTVLEVPGRSGRAERPVTIVNLPFTRPAAG